MAQESSPRRRSTVPPEDATIMPPPPPLHPSVSAPPHSQVADNAGSFADDRHLPNDSSSSPQPTPTSSFTHHSRSRSSSLRSPPPHGTFQPRSPPPPQTHLQARPQARSPPPSQPQAQPQAQPQFQPQPQPIQEAVNTAFDRSDMSSQHNPDLVAHITEQVIKSLKIHGIGGNGSAPGASRQGIQTPMSSSSTAIPPRNVYTPPSPIRDDNSNVGSTTSEPLNQSQAEGIGERMQVPLRPAEKASVQAQGTQSSPATPRKGSEEDDTTPLERIWQPLFDADARPLPRLGQFLRGVANHIIEDFEPRQSLVITPQKMLRFYESTKISNEIYPWGDVFGGKMALPNLSALYCDLHCQHFFVQRAFDEKPRIPGLTPLGFEIWMTHAIRAHPDQEYQRFEKIAMDMPVSNADNIKERFPKQLPRRLFPKHSDKAALEHFEDSVLVEVEDNLQPAPRQSHRTRPGPPPVNAGPPPTGPPRSQPSPGLHPQGYAPPPGSAPPGASFMQPPPPNNGIERERQPYSTTSSEAAVDDPSGSSVPIERERHPYSSQLGGGGKLYDSDDSRTRRSSRPPHRSNTVSSSARPIIDPPEERGPPRARRPRRESVSYGQSNRRSMHRDPSTGYGNSNPYARSDSDMGSMGGQPGSNVHEGMDDGLSRHFSRDERSRRYTPDDIQRQPYAPAPGPKGGYDDEHIRRGHSQSTGYVNGNGYNNGNYLGQAPYVQPSPAPGRHGQ